jgi:cell surface hyaluronidase
MNSISRSRSLATPQHHVSSTLLRAAPTVVFAALLVSFAPAQGLPTVTKIAQPAPITVAGGGFENTAIASAEYDPTWPGWTFTPSMPSGGSGIAKNGATVLANSNPTTNGDYVAFIEGLSTIHTTINNVAPGRYRVTFQGAQRIRGATTDDQIIRVDINGTPAFEQELSDDGLFRTYVTDIVTVTGPGVGTLHVDFIGGMNTGHFDLALIDRVELDPVLMWNSAASWRPVGVPSANDELHIGDDAAVVIDGACKARSVNVEGKLMAADENCLLETSWLLVSGPNAHFSVGTEAAPFAYDFELSLNATDPLEEVLQGGTKFLMAMNGGTVDMHGSPKKSWTHLKTIQGTGPSNSLIIVDDATGWQVGDELVVAWTGYVSHYAGTLDRYGLPAGPSPANNPFQGSSLSQVRTIAGIDPVNNRVLLSAPIIRADHCTAGSNSYSTPSGSRSWTVEQRAEVGMLSHNVRVVGNNTNAGFDNGFGGHIMIMTCCPLMQPGTGRFSNVELHKLGQRDNLGRYPIHWHMQRDNGAGQYITDCSVHETFNRAITIHGSHGVLAQGNVCFDSEGHAVFFEDGVEQNNKLIENLVLGTRRPAEDQQMLEHDSSLDEPQNRSPAAFWISHPNNEIRGNVAADSLGTGFWFALHSEPTGLSSSDDWKDFFSDYDVGSGTYTLWNATEAPLGAFEDNLCHSLKMGIDAHDSIDDNGTLGNSRDDDILKNVAWDPPTDTYLERFRAYGCTNAVYTGASNDFPSKIHFRDCVLTDNGMQMQFASADTMIDSLLVYDNGNNIFPSNFNFNSLDSSYMGNYERGHAYVVYDGPGNLYDSHLVGYDGPNSGSVFYSDFGAARRHPNHLIHGLTYSGGATVIPTVNFTDFTVPPPAHKPPHGPGVWGIAVIDEDGSLSRGSLPGWTLVTNHPFMHVTDSTGLQSSPDISLPQSPTAWLSPFHWGHLQVRYYAGPGMNVLLARGLMPPVLFNRQAWQGYDAVTVTTGRPGSQFRQVPTIAKRLPSTAPECIYDLLIVPPLPSQTTLPLNRVDISIDDAALGDITRVRITHRTKPSWSPTLYVNDNPDRIHSNGDNPANLTPFPPGMGAGAITAYQIIQTGTANVDTIDLRLVNTGRTHRISITW